MEWHLNTPTSRRFTTYVTDLVSSIYVKAVITGRLLINGPQMLLGL